MSQQEKLFEVPKGEPRRAPIFKDRKRPTKDDAEVLNPLSEETFKILSEWDSEGFGNDDYEEWEAEIKKFWRFHNPSDDTFDLVKSMENSLSLNGDSTLVEDLGSLSWIVPELIAEQERFWVKDNDIKVPFELGEKVNFFNYSYETNELYVNKIDEEKAYVYLGPEIGSNSNLIVRCENVKKLKDAEREETK